MVELMKSQGSGTRDCQDPRRWMLGSWADLVVCNSNAQPERRWPFGWAPSFGLEEVAGVYPKALAGPNVFAQPLTPR